MSMVAYQGSQYNKILEEKALCKHTKAVNIIKYWKEKAGMINGIKHHPMWICTCRSYLNLPDNSGHTANQLLEFKTKF